jgi:LysR family transcriptional regulator, glycine cleavage system transcriptional activator
MSLTHAKLRQPSLLAVRAFEAAGRLGSFTRAADELGLTQSAISRHVRSLEDQFGLALFSRHGKRIMLTDAGASYLRDVAAGLDRVREANARLAQQSRPEHRVTISMLPSVAALWLAPRLHEFTDRHPDVDLRIHAARAIVDFDKDEVDLAIRYGRGNWPNCRAELLATEELTPVCSPTLAKRFELYSAPENLLQAPLLRDDIPDGWDGWLSAAKLDPGHAKYGPIFDEGSALYGAAVAGAGVALGRDLLVRRYLDEGVLVTPLPISFRASFSYWLVWPIAARPNRAVKSVTDWLRSLAARK